MPAIQINAFSGALPAVSPRLLPTENATTALNTLLEDGDLKPMEGVLVDPVQPLLPAFVRTLYKYNDRFFAWSARVNAMASPVIADPYDRVYFSGLDVPRVTRNDIALGAGVLPSLSFPLGVAAPTAPSATYATPAEDDDEKDYADDSTRFYLRTYVTRSGEESGPSPLSAKVVVTVPGTAVNLALPVLAVNANEVELQRIYRTATGATESGFLLVAELPYTTAAYSDTLLDEDLGPPLSTGDYLPPPAGMKGLCSITGGIALGFVGRTLYVSEAYEPYTYPTAYQQTTQHRIVGICPLSSGALVVTEGYPYVLTGTMPGAVSLDKLDDPYPCVSERSLVNMDGFVMYASQDGLVGAGSGGAKLLTEEVFTPAQWRALAPHTLHAYYHDGMYIAFYGDTSDTGNGIGAFIYDPSRKDVTFVNVYAQAGFRDLASDTLYLVIDGQLCQWRKGPALPYRWVSKVFETPPVSFQRYRLKGVDLSGTLLTILADGQPLFTRLYTQHDPYPGCLPPGQFSRYQLQLEGVSTVTSVSLATEMGEL
ncbi:MAG: hypothetical protein K2W88_15905 [Pararheinheimera sp.]|nr:hypothetical protein [Rheinheimera sp.]